MKPLAHFFKWFQLYDAEVAPTALNNKTDRICHLSNSQLQITCSLGWPLTFYISKEDIKLLIPRPPFTTNHSDYWHTPPYPDYEGLEAEHRVYVFVYTKKHSTD